MSREISDAFAAKAEQKAGLLRALAPGAPDRPPEPAPDSAERTAAGFDGGARRDQPKQPPTEGEFLSAILEDARRNPSGGAPW